MASKEVSAERGSTPDRARQAGALDGLDRAVGGLLSWVAGRDSVHRGRCATDGALGALLSWTGLVNVVLNQKAATP